VWSTGTAPAEGNVYSGSATVTDPVANQTMAAVTITVAGYYSVMTGMVLSGAPTAADINNLWIQNLGSGSNVPIQNGDATGVPYYGGLS
jgi:hypothetical protein